jgi:hypothetical protein
MVELLAPASIKVKDLEENQDDFLVLRVFGLVRLVLFYHGPFHTHTHTHTHSLTHTNNKQYKKSKTDRTLSQKFIPLTPPPILSPPSFFFGLQNTNNNNTNDNDDDDDDDVRGITSQHDPYRACAFDKSYWFTAWYVSNAPSFG